MKIQILFSLTVAALLAGCSEPRHMGAAVDNDQNVLTGGPIVGTTIQDLPQAVKDTLQQRVPRAEIADIDKTSRNGQTMYEITFTQPRKHPEMDIADDGTVLSGGQK